MRAKRISLTAKPMFYCLIALSLLPMAVKATEYPDSVWIPAKLYDFRVDKSNPDFYPTVNWQLIGPTVVKGMVDTLLGTEYLPLRGDTCRFSFGLPFWFSSWEPQFAQDSAPIYDGKGVITGFSLVDHDTLYKNISFDDSICFLYSPLIHDDGYSFEDTQFDPLHDKGFGDEGIADRNYGFTLHLTQSFVFRDNLYLQCGSDDDLWIFINRTMVADIGGLHINQIYNVSLDGFGFQVGQKCTLSVFYADRGPLESSLRISSNIFAPEPPTGNVPRTHKSIMPSMVQEDLASKCYNLLGKVIKEHSIRNGIYLISEDNHKVLRINSRIAR